MSDLEDLDHEPEPVHPEEELHSAEPVEEELSAPAHDLGAEPDTDSFAPPKTAISSALVKIAVVVVVLVVGGAYFVLSPHHTAKAPSKTAAESTPSSAYKMPPPKSASVTEPLKNTKTASATDPLAWSGSTTPVPYPPPVTTAPTAAPAPFSAPGAATPLSPGAMPPLAAAIPAPPAIPAGAPAISAASGHQAAAPFAAPSSGVPPIVNDMPPPTAQLANAGGTMPPFATTPSATTPFATTGAVMPGRTSPTPAAAPSAAPARTNTLSPLMPEAIPAPVQKQAVQRPAVKGWPPQIRNGEPMPSAPVAAVSKMEISRTPAPATPSAESEKVQALENEITDLKKTISQLQQASVMKEDTAGKAVEKTAEGENAEEPATSPKKAHRNSSHHHHHTSHHKPQRTAAARRSAHHVIAVKWVLKAAKPDVAWVAQKGSSDISMVEPGDSLPGIGRVISINRNSSGYWVVRGTKGRISQ